MDIQYRIDHDPVAQGRPRFAKGRAYDPPRSKAYKELVKLVSRKYFPEPLEGPIEIAMFFDIKIPKSWPAWKKQEKLRTYHSSKPDIDNLSKAILDALNGIAYKDDSQVAQWVARKCWSECPGTFIRVRTLNDDQNNDKENPLE